MVGLGEAMQLIDRKEIRKKAANKRARGSIALKTRRAISVEQRKKREERAENTPYLDEMLELA